MPITKSEKSIKQIYSIINKQDYKNIYNNYTISHLENIEHKIEQILDIDSSDNTK